jgi:Tol biopolymer transport system component/DNA-binding winged helix-turn-helix (wHTH) protein
MISERDQPGGETAAKSTTYEFAEFSYDGREKLLRRRGAVVAIPPKTCELLSALLENRGRLMTKETLLEQVWPGTFVEEANLSHHIAVLRKALGRGDDGTQFIETVPRRGYRFTAPVDASGGISIEVTFTERTRTRTTVTEEDATGGPTHGRIVSVSRAWVLGSIVLLVSAVAAAMLAYSWTPSSHVSARAVAPVVTRVGDRDISISVISPDGRFLAFAQNSSTPGGGGLYVRQLETSSDITLLEPDGSRTFGDMKLSLDGSTIYFIAFEHGSKTGGIYRIPILGGARQKIVDLTDNAASLAVSPDNRQIAFYRFGPAGEGSLVAVSPDNPPEEKALLSFRSGEVGYDGFLSWSPDGRYIAVTNTSDGRKSGVRLRRFDVMDGSLADITHDGYDDIGKHVFSSDGREIFFIGDRPDTRDKFFVTNIETGATRTLPLGVTASSFYSYYGLSITADGKTLAACLIENPAGVSSIPAEGGGHAEAIRIKRGDDDGMRGMAALPGGQIVYTASTNGKVDIWKLLEDGSGRQPLTSDAHIEKNLTTSPDGRFIVFVSDAGGGSHLFRMDLADAGSVKQLTFGDAVDRHPSISPDGGRIVYISEKGGKSLIKTVRIDGSDGVVLNDSEDSVRPVFSPDGRKIAFQILSPIRSQPGTIAIMPADGGKPERTFPVADFNYRTSTTPLIWTPDGILFLKSETTISNLWRLDLRSETAAPITQFSDEVIYSFAPSSDGRRIYLSRGLYRENAVLISNF